MAYVPGHKRDIFVSYSWADAKRTGDTLIRDWSIGMAERLRKEFGNYGDVIGEFSFFIDKSDRADEGITGTGGLTDQLKTNAESAALLVAIISDFYIKSDYCKKERTWWLAGQENPLYPILKRIAVVRAWPISATLTWPEEFLDSEGAQLPGYQFFDKAVRAELARPFGYEIDQAKPAGHEFNKAIINMAAELVRILREYRFAVEEREKELAALTKLETDAGQLLYLRGRESQREPWDAIRQKLDDDGYALTPGVPHPIVENKELQEKRISLMVNSDAGLLVATNDGPDPDVELVSFHQDRKSARERSGKLLPCAVIDTARNIAGTSIRRSTAHKLNIGWIDTTPPTWTIDLRRWLAATAAAAK